MDNMHTLPWKATSRVVVQETKLAEDYPAGMARELAKCLAFDEFSHEEIYAAGDESALDRMMGGLLPGDVVMKEEMIKVLHLPQWQQTLLLLLESIWRILVILMIHTGMMGMVVNHWES